MRGYYTGVGSRKTPDHILDVMENLALFYKSKDWVLRSGGASGADTAFSDGAGDNKEIYTANVSNFVSATIYSKAVNIASKVHPLWRKLPDYARKLHTRNVFQVLGSDLNTPSSFLICWTPDGCISHETRTIGTGGTGTAISIADLAGIPVLNLNRQDHLWKTSLVLM